MKNLQQVFLLSLFVVIGLCFQNCVKEREILRIEEKETIRIDTVSPPPVYTIVGVWEGTYTVDEFPNLGQQYYNLIIKSDGSVINETKWTNQIHINTGTWIMKNDTLICNTLCIYGYSYNVGIRETHIALFDKGNGKLALGEIRNPERMFKAGNFKVTKSTDSQ